MKWFFILLLATGAANAQTIIYPPPLNGQGTMSVSASASINSSNVTATTSSSAFPTKRLPAGYLRIKVQGNQTAGVAVCWLGGASACTVAAGEQILVGESVTKGMAFADMTAGPPTIIAVSGTVTIEVEW